MDYLKNAKEKFQQYVDNVAEAIDNDPILNRIKQEYTNGTISLAAYNHQRMMRQRRIIDEIHQNIII